MTFANYVTNSQPSRKIVNRGVLPRSTICGFAAVLGVLSKPQRCKMTGRQVRVKFAPGCFSHAIEVSNDITLCIDHDELKSIAESFRGQILLRETRYGFWFQSDVSDSPLSRQVYRKLKLGILNQGSITFRHGDVQRYVKDGETILEHVKVEKIYDIALTRNPLFPQTRIALVEARTPAIEARKIKMLKYLLLFRDVKGN